MGLRNDEHYCLAHQVATRIICPANVECYMMQHIYSSFVQSTSCVNEMCQPQMPVIGGSNVSPAFNSQSAIS